MPNRPNKRTQDGLWRRIIIIFGSFSFERSLSERLPQLDVQIIQRIEQLGKAISECPWGKQTECLNEVIIVTTTTPTAATSPIINIKNHNEIVDVFVCGFIFHLARHRHLNWTMMTTEVPRSNGERHYYLSRCTWLYGTSNGWDGLPLAGLPLLALGEGW